jgi:peroxiredoxin
MLRLARRLRDAERPPTVEAVERLGGRTVLAYIAKLRPEFQRRNTKVIALSVDSVASHARWAVDVAATQGHAPDYPMIADTTLEIAKAWACCRPTRMAGARRGRREGFLDNAQRRLAFPDRRCDRRLW